MPDQRTLNDFVLAGRWRFQKVIGAGADGTVYLAVDVNDHTPVAIKVFDSMVDDDVEVVKHRIESEASLVQLVNSPWVVRFIQHGVARARGGKQAAYTVMEHLQGHTLRSELNYRRLPLVSAAELFDRCMRGVDALHRVGWVHMDIKPENIFVCDENLVGREGSVKLFDFGNARPVQTAFTVGARGTPLYAAPELCSRTGEVGQHTDVYSLGIVMYEVLAGRAPMVMDSVEQIVATHVYGTLDPLPQACPTWMSDIYRRATARSGADRFPNAGAMLSEWTAAMRLYGIPG